MTTSRSTHHELCKLASSQLSVARIALNLKKSMTTDQLRVLIEQLVPVADLKGRVAGGTIIEGTTMDGRRFELRIEDDQTSHEMVVSSRQFYQILQA